MANAELANFLRCPDGMAHSWAYLGKLTQMYRCTRCAMHASKAKLQEVSNAELHR